MRRGLVAVVVLTVALTGCSKKSSAKGTELEAYDYRFDPTTLNVKEGQSVTLEFKNEGKAEHNFSITSLGISKDLDAGESVKVTFKAPTQMGDVQYFCKYHKDSKGMVGS